MLAPGLTGEGKKKKKKIKKKLACPKGSTAIMSQGWEWYRTNKLIWPFWALHIFRLRSGGKLSNDFHQRKLNLLLDNAR